MTLPAKGALPVFLILGLCFGCATREPVIPEPLAREVDQQVDFVDIRATPHSFIGRTVALGGEVLAAKRTQEGTVLELLQLPLQRLEPVPERGASQGRFLAVHRAFLDPATLPPGTRLTIVGEVAGTTSRGLQDLDYTYPKLDVKHVKVWEEPAVPGARSRPWWGGVSIGGGTGIGLGVGGGVGIGF